MVLRAYRPEDLREILALFYDTVHTVNRADYSPEQLDAWAPAAPDEAEWQRRLCSLRTLVAAENEKIAGFADMDGTGYLDCLFVRRDCQRRGAARLLISSLEREAASRGIAAVRTEASITARPFFEKMGYHMVRRQEKPHNGCTFVNFIMEKRLKGMV